MTEHSVTTHAAARVARALERYNKYLIEAGSPEKEGVHEVAVGGVVDACAQALECSEAELPVSARRLLFEIDELSSDLSRAGLEASVRDLERARPHVVQRFGVAATEMWVPSASRDRGTIRIIISSWEEIRVWTHIGSEWERHRSLGRFYSASTFSEWTEALVALRDQLEASDWLSAAQRAHLVENLNALIDDLGSVHRVGADGVARRADAVVGSVLRLMTVCDPGSETSSFLVRLIGLASSIAGFAQTDTSTASVSALLGGVMLLAASPQRALPPAEEGDH